MYLAYADVDVVREVINRDPYLHLLDVSCIVSSIIALSLPSLVFYLRAARCVQVDVSFLYKLYQCEEHL